MSYRTLHGCSRARTVIHKLLVTVVFSGLLAAVPGQAWGLSPLFAPAAAPKGLQAVATSESAPAVSQTALVTVDSSALFTRSAQGIVPATQLQLLLDGASVIANLERSEILGSDNFNWIGYLAGQ